MGKIAFVFSGQGAQHTGMGQELFEKEPAAQAIFERADALRPGTSEQCFQGNAELLSVTKNTQPCLFAVEIAAAAALEAVGIRAEMAAGFSLEELAALTYAKSADFDTMFTLVCRRGELMQEAAERTPAAMAAVVKLTAEKDILGISRTKAYEYEYVKSVYEKKEPFRVIKVGDNYRIVRSSFEKWLEGN